MVHLVVGISEEQGKRDYKSRPSFCVLVTITSSVYFVVVFLSFP